MPQPRGSATATEALQGDHRLCDMSSRCRERKKASCDGAMSPGERAATADTAAKQRPLGRSCRARVALRPRDPQLKTILDHRGRRRTKDCGHAILTAQQKRRSGAPHKATHKNTDKTETARLHGFLRKNSRRRRRRHRRPEVLCQCRNRPSQGRAPQALHEGLGHDPSDARLCQ